MAINIEGKIGQLTVRRTSSFNMSSACGLGVPVKCETKRNKSKRNSPKRNETKLTKTKRNGIIQNEIKSILTKEFLGEIQDQN